MKTTWTGLTPRTLTGASRTRGGQWLGKKLAGATKPRLVQTTHPQPPRKEQVIW